MSHPDPKHDPSNVYPSDGFRSGTGGLSKKTRKTLGISELTNVGAKAQAIKKKIGKSAEDRISDKVYRENSRGDFRNHPITGEPMSKILGRKK